MDPETIDQTGSADALGIFPCALRSRLLKLPETQLARLIAPPIKHKSQLELFRDACVLKRAGFSEDEQEQVLRARFADYYRPIPDREIERAVANALGESIPPARRWPEANPKMIAEAVRGSGSLSELSCSSPVAAPHLLSTGSILDRLFGKTDLLCMGKSKHHADTEERLWFGGHEQHYKYVVPNPMISRLGVTKDGRTSKRCLNNSGPWLTQVIEFDFGTLDEQARLHLKLKSLNIPLRMVVFSGGKSLHGWFDVRGWPEAHVEKFRRYAAALGADRATFLACQFVRAPNATRENGERQKVVYLA